MAIDVGTVLGLVDQAISALKSVLDPLEKIRAELQAAPYIDRNSAQEALDAVEAAMPKVPPPGVSMPPDAGKGP